jgi:hypothetical protein
MGAPASESARHSSSRTSTSSPSTVSMYSLAHRPAAERLRRHDHVAANQLLGLDERSVEHADAIAGILVAPPPRAGAHGLGDEVRARARGLFDQPRQLRPLHGRPRHAGLRRGSGLPQNHVAPRGEVRRLRRHSDVPGLGDGPNVDLDVIQRPGLARGPLDCLLERHRSAAT